MNEDISDTLNHIAETIRTEDLPVANPTIHWYTCDDAELRAIMAAFPDANWRPASSGGGTDWISGRIGKVALVAFAATPPRETAPRLQALFSS